MLSGDLAALPGKIQEVSSRWRLTSWEGNLLHKVRLGNTECWDKGGFTELLKAALFCSLCKAQCLPAREVPDVGKHSTASSRRHTHTAHSMAGLFLRRGKAWNCMLGAVSNGNEDTNQPLSSSLIPWSIHILLHSVLTTTALGMW